MKFVRNMKTTSALSFALAVLLLNSGCKKNNDTTIPVYTVPTTYNFTNFNDSNQLKLIAMADQIGVAINLANTTPNTVVSAQKLIDMFNNVNNYFNDSSLKLNASGLKLSNYCPAAMKADFINYFDSIGLYSQSSAAASPGVAGVGVSSVSANKKYLLSPTGVFYSQVFKKTINAMCWYQIANVFMTDSIKSSVDNNTVVAGQGTALEHHWDEAFGFYGVPVTFPTTTSGLKYLGSYSNQVDAGLHCNATLMNAFLKGRAAISNKDGATMNAQAKIIINTLELLDGAAVVQEMKETDANLDAGDAMAAYGTLSETLGFVRAMKYNTSPARIITDAQINQLLALLDSASPNTPNLYKFVGVTVNTTAQIKAKTDAIRQFVGTVYGWNAATLALL